MKKPPRVAIVYDRVNKFGGAERVLISMKRLYKESVLFTSVYDAKAASWVGDWEVRTSFLQRIPFAKAHHEWFALLMPLAFESLNFTGFDVIISVTSEFAKTIVTTPDQLHICYCLTPTRYLWSHTREYGKGYFSLVKSLLFSHLRVLDYASAQRPQAFIAISRRVQDRIAHYYRRPSQIIFPPATFRPINSTKSRKRDYFLVVARLVPYKRVDLAITACMAMRRKLRIVGTGSLALKLYELAAGSKYIQFEGKVNDKQLSKLYCGAKALICPQEEDFGLVSLEAHAHGVPVISYKKSGVAETILDGKTGILFTDQTVTSLCRALRVFEKQNWNAKRIRANVKSFSEIKFQERFQRSVNKLWKKMDA